MPAADVGVLNTTIDQLISSSRQLFAQYQAVTAAQASMTSQAAALQSQLSEKELTLQDLNRLTSTYEQEFLDRKNNPPPKTLFGKLGLSTVQDWSLALFFFSYIIFAVMVFILAMIHTTQRFRVGLILVFLFFLGGVIASGAIMMIG